MSTRRGELVAMDESTVVAKPLFDAIVVKDSQGDRGLSDPAGTNESDRREVFYETDNIIDQPVTSKEDCGWWRRWLPRYARRKHQMLIPLVIEITDLF